MSLPKGFREWLAKESAAWNSDGLIDAGQRERILNRYPEESADSGALAFALRTLAVLLFGAALFLVISHNWADFSREGQLAVVFTVLAVIQGAGIYFFLKGQERSAIIGHLLGCLMYGGGIALIGQIYHLDAHAPDAILAWCVFTIPFALLLDATVLHLLVIVLAGSWLSMETGHYAWRSTVLYHWERATFLLLLIPSALAAYRRARPALAGALAWSTLFLWFMFAGFHTPAHLFVLPLALAALHPTGDPRGRGFRFIGTLGVSFVTLALGRLDGSNYRSFAEHFLRHDFVFSTLTAGLAVWAIVRARQRQDSHAAWLGLVALLALGCSLLGSLSVDQFKQRDSLWVLIVAIANVTTLLLAVTLIRQGLGEKRLRPYAYGALVFLAWLTWRYVDIEKDLGYLGMAGIFSFIGLVLFGLAMVWRQPREAEITEEMPDFRPAWLEPWVAKLNTIQRPLVFGALALQFAVLGWMVYNHSRPQASGERFLLRCEPVDPRDLMKGDYVILRYGFQNLTDSQRRDLLKEWKEMHPSLATEPDESLSYMLPKDTRIFIPLRKGVDGIADYGEPTLKRPTSGPFLQTRFGQSNWAWGTDVRAGIESYYVAEGTGLEWEKLRNKGKLLAEVGILPNGQAGLISLQATETGTLRAFTHRSLERFFVTLKADKPVTKLISTEADFAATFHPAPLNGQNAVTPKFPQEYVLLHTLPETDVDTTILFTGVRLTNGHLHAEVRVIRGAKQTFTTRPQAAIIVSAQDLRGVSLRDEKGERLLEVRIRK